jgi:hypothetical protein
VVSAYGGVGLSTVSTWANDDSNRQGYPGVKTAFSSQFRVLSKLVIVALMVCFHALSLMKDAWTTSWFAEFARQSYYVAKSYRI